MVNNRPYPRRPRLVILAAALLLLGASEPGRHCLVRCLFHTPWRRPARKVLAQASVAQIFVPYDDNGARFHDITDYGAGSGNMNDLTPADCPNGSLLQYTGKDVPCLQIENRGYAHKYYGNQLQGHSLSLFSVSHIGEYSYITTWEFLDDGTIAPSVGATGELQRYGSNAAYGWPLGGDGNGFQSSPANAYGDEGLFAVDLDSGTTKLLSCTDPGKDKHIYYNYSLPIGSGVTIDGIQVRLDTRAESAENSPRLCVQLSWDGCANHRQSHHQ